MWPSPGVMLYCFLYKHIPVAVRLLNNINFTLSNLHLNVLVAIPFSETWRRLGSTFYTATTIQLDQLFQLIVVEDVRLAGRPGWLRHVLSGAQSLCCAPSAAPIGCVCVCVNVSQIPEPWRELIPIAADESVHTRTLRLIPRSAKRLFCPNAAPVALTTQ